MDAGPCSLQELHEPEAVVRHGPDRRVLGSLQAPGEYGAPDGGQDVHQDTDLEVRQVESDDRSSCLVHVDDPESVVGRVDLVPGDQEVACVQVAVADPVQDRKVGVLGSAQNGARIEEGMSVLLVDFRLEEARGGGQARVDLRLTDDGEEQFVRPHQLHVLRGGPGTEDFAGYRLRAAQQTRGLAARRGVLAETAAGQLVERRHQPGVAATPLIDTEETRNVSLREGWIRVTDELVGRQFVRLGEVLLLRSDPEHVGTRLDVAAVPTDVHADQLSS
ncbi:hypothetical protein ABZ905_18750 [Streptomyces parvus]|uniref:hypothetical protein n=1 Tax=Streptomyces parvus TaxID=66428 RepID=UPI0033D67EB7